VVAERLGHADPAITLGVYAHVIRQHADGVAATFAAALDGAPDADDDPWLRAGGLLANPLTNGTLR
jgi:integrase